MALLKTKLLALIGTLTLGYCTTLKPYTAPPQAHSLPADVFRSYAEHIECNDLEGKERADCAKTAANYVGMHIFRPLFTLEDCLELFKAREDRQTVCELLTTPRNILLSDDLPSYENYLRHEFLHAAYSDLDKKEIKTLERAHRVLRPVLEKVVKEEMIDSTKLLAASCLSTEFYAYLAGGLNEKIATMLKAELARAAPGAYAIYEELEARAQEWLESWMAAEKVR